MTTFLHIQELHFNKGESYVLNNLNQRVHKIQLSSGSLTTESLLQIPFDDNEEKEITWLLEQYPKSPKSFPLTRAENARIALGSYARSLIGQLSDTQILQDLVARGEGISNLRIQIQGLGDEGIDRSGRFFSTYWEILEDIGFWTNSDLRVDTVQVVRCVSSPEEISDRMSPRLPSPPHTPLEEKFRILFVCAKRGVDGTEEVQTRLLMDPIFEIIIQAAKSRQCVTSAEMLRPGTWKGFVDILHGHGYGYFSVVHFDCHGWVSDGRACLDFVGENGGVQSVTASEVAMQLLEAGVQMVNLNACSSGMNSRGLESNLAYCFAKAGVTITIAMAYDILDVASSMFEMEFYRSWLWQDFRGSRRRPLCGNWNNSPEDLARVDESIYQAVRIAREALKDNHNRYGAGGWESNLGDHIVPVVYINSKRAQLDREIRSYSSSSSQISCEEIRETGRKLFLKAKKSFSGLPKFPVTSPTKHEHEVVEEIVSPAPEKREVIEEIVSPIPRKHEVSETILSPIPRKHEVSEILVSSIPSKQEVLETIVSPIPRKYEVSEILTSPIIAISQVSEDGPTLVPPKPTIKIDKTGTMFSSLQPNGFRFKDIDPPLIGRDRTISELENALVQSNRNIAFIEGNGGSGKSILVRNICDWWKSTGYVKDFFYFDCRKYAVLEEAHDHPNCTVEVQIMMTRIQEFIFTTLFPEEVPTGGLGSQLLTTEQTRKLLEELKSGKYLLVFDNAGFPLKERNGMVSPAACLTTGSGFICRKSLIASATAVASLEGFIREIHTGQSRILITGRQKQWFVDYLPDVNPLIYKLPNLSLSAALSIGRNKSKLTPEFEKLCEYPEAAEDFALLVDFLQFNPLSIELIYASMARENIRPNDAYLRLCSDSLHLQASDASMAYAGAGRFLIELEIMADTDWNDGADESRLPFALFWMAECTGYLPTNDNGRYWFFLIRSLAKSWGDSIEHLGLTLTGSRESIEELLLKPIFSEDAHDEITDMLGIHGRTIQLCNQMEELGLVEQEIFTDTEPTPAIESTANIRDSRFRVHPLFSIVARKGTFGNGDVEHLKALCQWRRDNFLHFKMVSYMHKFNKQYLGNPPSAIDLASGNLDGLNIDRSVTTQTLRAASQELPSLITTITWLSQASDENLERWRTLPILLNGILNPLSNLWVSRREIIYPLSQALDGLYQALIGIMERKPTLFHPDYVSFTAQQALRLASLTSYRSGLDTCKTYLDQARKLISRVQTEQTPDPKLHWRLDLLLLEADALEALDLFNSGDIKNASVILNRLLTQNPPAWIPIRCLPLYLNLAFCTWLSYLKSCNHDFPSQHTLLQSKKPLIEIIREYKVAEQLEMDTFIEPVKEYLERTLYDIIGSETSTKLRPRNKSSGARFFKDHGARAGENIAVVVDTGLSTIFRGGPSSQAESTPPTEFISQPKTVSKGRLSAIHMRISQYFIANGKWVEALHHLKAYSKIPFSIEDHGAPGLRSQNHLLACLCFSKLDCYDLAREHAFKAIEQADKAPDDGESLSIAIGAFAGIESGRINRYSIIPKLLLLKVIEIMYSSSPTSPIPNFKLRNRKGDYLMQLSCLISHLSMAWAFNNLTEAEKVLEIGYQYPGMEYFEDKLDRMIFIVDQDIQAKMERARGGREIWMDRELEVGLYTEAEHILFAKEVPVLNHFKESLWAKFVVQRRKLHPNRPPTFSVTELDLPTLRQTLNLPTRAPSFDLPSSYSKPEIRREGNDDDNDDGDDSDEEEESISRGYRKSTMFGNRFMEPLIDRSLRKGVVAEDVWVEIQASFEVLEAEYSVVKVS